MVKTIPPAGSAAGGTGTYQGSVKLGGAGGRAQDLPLFTYGTPFPFAALPAYTVYRRISSLSRYRIFHFWKFGLLLLVPEAAAGLTHGGCDLLDPRWYSVPRARRGCRFLATPHSSYLPLQPYSLRIYALYAVITQSWGAFLCSRS